MTLTRRAFNRRFFQFATGAIVPTVLLERCQQPEVRPVNTASLATGMQGYISAVVDELIPETELLVPTYLGNDRRRFYGRGIPQSLNLLHKLFLGSGRSYLGRSLKTWTGAGWTGQPTIIKDLGKTYAIIGAFDHHLRKLDLSTNRVVWQYKFDDILKGSSTVYIDPLANDENRVVILQGSRRGLTNPVRTPKPVPSFRAISFRTGRELWRLNLKLTRSFSRDNDSSAIDLGNGLIFNVGENGIGYFLNSATVTATAQDGIVQPQIFSEVKLYQDSDAKRYGGNLVAESSPARLDDRLFLAAGGGRIYGISTTTREIIWQFLAGGDLNGTIAISDENRLFCAVEREKVPGSGGVFKLNPDRPPEEAAEWFFPTLNRGFNNWKGGIVGSVALNDEYRSPEIPALFATNAIDGNLYIGSQHQVTGNLVKGPFLQKTYNTPFIAFQKRLGASISTPVFTDGNRLVVAGYNGVYLLQLNFEPVSPEEPNALKNDLGQFYRLVVAEIGRFKPGVSFESTPVVWDGIVRICSRDGWMYTLG
ncbi:MAG: hypothetical protein SWY16_08865 [Cyanobacteriota bacterium]|nr:hypothetical protein [Cyanobacteriota bacterium]